MGLFTKSVGESGKPNVVDPADAPWFRAATQHENTFLRLSAQVANWRLFAFFSLSIAAIAVCGVIWMGLQSKYIPQLVEVDKLGHTLAVKALTGADAITDSRRTSYRELFDLIENLRTVTTDRMANNKLLANGFSRLDGAAKNYVRTELKKAPPNEVGTTKTVQVKVKSALKLAGKSWQMEWEETSYSLSGVVIGTETWRAMLQFDLTPHGDEESIRVNPTGFTVSELSWQKVI